MAVAARGLVKVQGGDQTPTATSLSAGLRDPQPDARPDPGRGQARYDGHAAGQLDGCDRLHPGPERGALGEGGIPRPLRPAARDDRLRLAPAERREGIAGTEIERIPPGRDILKARTFLVLAWSRVDLLS